MKQTIAVTIDTDDKWCGDCAMKLLGICYLKYGDGLTARLLFNDKKQKNYRTKECLKEAKPCRTK